MSKRVHIPELRFKEFSGEWEEKILKEVSKINPKSDKLPSSFIYIDLESVEKGILVKEDIIYSKSAPSRAQRLLKKDDILFQMVRPYQRNNYFFNLNGDYVASTGYAQVRTEEISKFLYYYLHTDNFVNIVNAKCTGTSYPAINSTDLSNIKINLPKKSEQQKIASFLTTIDTKIEQLTKKVELQEQYKKGVMQKIFNQEIRFKNDDGSEFPEWEEKRLKDTCEIKKGQQLNRNTLTNDSKYPVINGGVEPSGYTDNFNTNENTITISEGGNSCGFVNFIKTKFWSGGHCYILQPILIIDINFLYQLLKYNELKIMKLRVGSGLPNIQKKDIENFKINLPSPPEQTKIANFFSTLDKQIGSTKKQLAKTKEFKKGLLQRMFV